VWVGTPTQAVPLGKERYELGAKKRQTMGKIIRERERAEKRQRKQEKKDEKKAAALEAAPVDAGPFASGPPIGPPNGSEDPL
jgi:hypothetical protein